MKSRVGEKYLTNEGDEVEIIEYFSNVNISLRFKDGTITKNNQFSSVKRGTVKNPNTPSVFGIGYNGQGIHIPKVNGVLTKVYQTWSNMLRRCYSEVYHKKFPTYIGCSVVKDWHNFQNFAEWFYSNYQEGWFLDKDLLTEGNKIYSPETCCFVPHKINTLVCKNTKDRGELPIGVSRKGNRFVAQIRYSSSKTVNLGTYDTPKEAFEVYKGAKENYIKELLMEYNTLDIRVVDTLLNYSVKIND